MKSLKKVLIIGGTSGLGLAMAQIFSKSMGNVFVTGTHDPSEKDLTFINLKIGDDAQGLATGLDRVIGMIQRVDILVYAAGFCQLGTVSQLNDSAIRAMINVGLTAPAMLLQRVLRVQHLLPGVILITSTSQERPRVHEPVYSAAKAGLAMFGNSLALDPCVAKVMVVAPAGMNTNMWLGAVRSGVLLDPKWVAGTILDLFEGKYRYKFIRVLRDPARTEIVEQRS